MPKALTQVLLAACVSALVTHGSLTGAWGATPEDLDFFENQVRPVLAARCYKCHADENQKGGLRLDSLATILQGGDSGPAVVPGRPDESLLIEAINYASFEMPPNQQLPESEITALVAWVRKGAPWPEIDGDQVALRDRSQRITDEDRAFWSFQPLSPSDPPDVDSGVWVRNEIDHFIQSRLAEADLAPAPESNRRELIRRLYFDLIGLPPTAEEVAAFLQDQSPTAYENLVDRLLKSPRYGERWARHWLDLVRYAESDGFKQDAYRTHAWRYRDYVIRSFNDDKPYDQFVREQLAGDEIAPHDREALAATSFLRHWIYEYNQRDVRTQWDNILNDMTNVTGEVFLGMSVGCARCHDHKFDPILREDYYRLRAFFAPLVPRDDIPFASADEWAVYEKQLAAWEQQTADIRRQLEDVARPHRKRAADGAIDKFPPDIRPMMRKPAEERSPFEQQLAGLAYRQVVEQYDLLDVESKLKGADKEKWKSLEEQLARFEKPQPLPPAFTATDVGPQAPPTTIPGDRAERDIPPGFLSVLDPSPATIEPAPAASQSTGRRYTLAQWLTRPDHPLTTRVIVNRVWQYHFGQGIVDTPSNFGRLGVPPSHGQLLDWLATWFVDNGWSLKRLHRLIVTSATYRQSSQHPQTALALERDLDNRLLWHFPVRRLDAEQIRDAALAVSGELDLTMGGPSVEADVPRRTIYTRVIRNTRDPLLAVFDAPDGFSSTPTRNNTTTPTQALLMLNGDWMFQRAEALAERLADKHAAFDANLINEAFDLVYGHQPRDGQRASALRFLDEPAARSAVEPGDNQAQPFPFQQRASVLIDPPNGHAPLHAADHPALPAADFTAEAFVMLRSLYEDAAVRTIVSQWDSNQQHPGWALGVTSTKSRYQPKNLILQLVGDRASAGVGYEVIASDLRVELNKPYYVAVSVRIADTSDSGIVFYLQDLSQPEAPLQTARVAHGVNAAYRTDRDLVVGGRDGSKSHHWDGLVAEIRLSSDALAAEHLLVGGSPAGAPSVVAHWRLGSDLKEPHSGIELIASSGSEPARRDPRFAALVDFCHVLLNSNEFLYID